jgi:uncharacterized protein (DUF1697 family)
MTRHVAFLRAVNVGGRGLISMERLRALFAKAGASSVETYIQSGNVVFTANTARLPALARRVKRLLDDELETDSAAAYRTLDGLVSLTSSEPFRARERERDAGVKLYVAFLAEKPRASPRLPLVDAKTGVEILALRGLDAIGVCLPVKGRYGFPNVLVERAFGVPATTRNWNTVVKVVEKFG